ncbi:hypothetical protein [Microvirga zambiensis]|jgi:hypothetical protein|uniref:hypothetical protein n=1 Tax=Microvirga zambiensis TaxID=1402137 RepID=UPI00191D03B5|nr:hypothetical protein [Microvirga zambiensis]
MHALAFVCCLIPFFWNPSALANEPGRGDCDTARAAAGDAISQDIKTFGLALEPYEAAIMAGNLVAFDEASAAVVRDWNGLILTINRERDRMREAGCQDSDLPDPSWLPTRWSVLRSLGAEHSVAQDRAEITRRFRSLPSAPMK